MSSGLHDQYLLGKILRMKRILLITIGLLCLTKSVLSCDQAKAMKCKSDFAQTLGVTAEDLEAGIVKNTDHGNLTNWCRSFETYKSCVREYKQDCPVLTRAVLEGVEDVYEYICGTGFNYHLKYSACLTQSKVEKGIVNCNEDYRKSTAGKVISENQLCEIFKNAVACVEDASQDTCGKESAEHQKEIEIQMWQPLASEFHCNLDGGTNIGLIAGAVAGVFVLIIISVGICYCCARYQNRNRYENQSECRAVPYIGNGSLPGTPHGTINRAPSSTYPGAYSGAFRGATATTFAPPPSMMSGLPPYSMHGHSYDDPDIMKKMPVFPNSAANTVNYSSIPRKV